MVVWAVFIKHRLSWGSFPCLYQQLFLSCLTALSREKQAEVLDTISYGPYTNGKFVEMQILLPEKVSVLFPGVCTHRVMRGQLLGPGACTGGLGS